MRQLIKKPRSKRVRCKQCWAASLTCHIPNGHTPRAMPTAARRGLTLPLPAILLRWRGHPASPFGRCRWDGCHPQRFCPLGLTSAAPVILAGEPRHLRRRAAIFHHEPAGGPDLRFSSHDRFRPSVVRSSTPPNGKLHLPRRVGADHSQAVQVVSEIAYQKSPDPSESGASNVGRWLIVTEIERYWCGAKLNPDVSSTAAGSV